MISFVSLPLAANVAVFAGAAFIVWIAGIRLTAYAKVIAERTGAEQAFVGILLLGAVVSLPEMYEMAFADAFGTNLFSTMLLFVADLAYPGGPILNEVDRFSLFAMLLGILLTAVYLAGFVERRHKTMLRMGIDSIIVLIAYGGGLTILFFLR